MATVLVGLLPARAAAQFLDDPNRRPSRGLFESREPGQVQTLDLTVSLYGARDETKTGGLDDLDDLDEAADIDRRLQTEGSYGGVNVALAYGVRTDRVSLGVTGASAGAYYENGSDRPVVNGSLRADLQAMLASRTTLRITQGATYSPFYGLAIGSAASGAVFGSEPSLFDFSVRAQDVYRFDTTFEFAQVIGRRTTLALFGDYQRTDFDGNDDEALWPELQSRRVGARLSRAITRYASLRLGYGYRDGEYGGAESGIPVVQTHDIDAGVDYNRALSLSRRTSLTFRTGSALVGSTPEPGDIDDGEGDRRTLRAYLLASAAINHEMGRTWNARLSYSRDLHYVDGFVDPFLADGAQVMVGGTFNRRVDSRFAASYSSGTVGQSSGQGYMVWSGTADLRTALARSAAVFVRYIYHHYEFNDGATLPPGFAPRLDRHGVRLGLSFWLPIV